MSQKDQKIEELKAKHEKALIMRSAEDDRN